MDEGKFQSTFIPKKTAVTQPMTQSMSPILKPTPTKPVRKTNFFSLVITILFILVLVVAGGTFGYNKILTNQNNDLDAELRTELAKIKPNDITTLSRYSTRVQTAQALLNQHLALSRFFDFLSKITLKTVRFNNFSYGIESEGVVVSMSGTAPSFATLALQSLEFSKPDAKAVISNPKFSNFNLDKGGDVTFSFSGVLIQGKFLYRDIVATSSASTTALPAASSTTQTASTTKSTGRTASTTSQRTR
jgi:hypothetical protein